MYTLEDAEYGLHNNVIISTLKTRGKKIYLDVRSEPFLHPPLALLGHVQLAEEAQLGHAGPDLSKTTQSTGCFFYWSVLK